MLEDLTVIILTYNEENNLPNLLKSLQGVTKNIYVVDSYSTDKSLEILSDSGITYSQHEFENYSLQRNYAQKANPFKTKWVLHLDADEPITSELKSWLVTDFKSLKNDFDGFMFSRKTIFLGRWIKHGGQYPNYHLRLFKTQLGWCENKAYDQHYIVDGLTKKIQGADIYNTVANDLDDFITSHNRWATKEANEICTTMDAGEVKANLFGTPIERIRWLKLNVFQKSPLFLRSFLYFFYRYIIRLGFLDGKQGLIFYVLQSFWFRFIVDAKVFETRINKKKT